MDYKTDNKNIFASNLKKYMDLNKKTRRDVSHALGISYYTVSDWVNGKKYPRMDKVELLANLFGIQKSDLIEEKMAEEDQKNSDAIIDITNRLFSDDHFLSVVNSLHKLKPDQFDRASGVLDLFFKEAFNEIQD